MIVCTILVYRLTYNPITPARPLEERLEIQNIMRVTHGRVRERLRAVFDGRLRVYQS
jgi:hypothetical protein